MFAKFKVGELESFPERLEEMLKQDEAEIESLIDSSNGDFSLVKRLDDLEERRELFFTPLSHLNSVLNSKESQRAYEKSIPILTKFYSSLGQNERLYQKLKKTAPNNRVQKKLLDDILQEFELSGVALDAKTKESLKEIDERLSTLSNEFSQNLLDATNSFEMIVEDFADVEELPKSDLDSAEFEEEGKLKWRFTLQMPSYLAYITYGTNRALREKIYRAYTSRAPQNSKVIDEILALRNQKAKLLGFENYAQLALQRRDAKSEDRVLDFLWELSKLFRDRAKDELRELEEFAKSLDDISELEAYDIAYYSEKLKREKFDFDENDTKPYFPRDRVVEGLFEILFELFGMEFRKSEIFSYHPSVEIWDIYKDDRVQARLYLDLEAREEKRGGAWMHNWESRFIDSNGSLHLPSAFVVANFPKASQNYPSLLRHSDVVTLFHEMGHTIHHLFSLVDERGVSGVNGVAWDTVEFPSQFLESFAYEEPILSKFAFHYESGEPMPKELMRKIKESKNFLVGMGVVRQLEFGLFDFMLHQKLYQGDEVQNLLDDVRERVAVVKPPKYNKFQNGFAHIFAGGYGAGYYSYKWAEVFSADAFIECLGSDGEFKRDKALGYLEHILQKGSSDSMSNLFKEWLGREPRAKALIELSK